MLTFLPPSPDGNNIDSAAEQGNKKTQYFASNRGRSLASIDKTIHKTFFRPCVCDRQTHLRRRRHLLSISRGDVLPHIFGARRKRKILFSLFIVAKEGAQTVCKANSTLHLPRKDLPIRLQQSFFGHVRGSVS